MLAVRSHNEGTVFFRAKDRHMVASVSMPNGKRPTLACPHKHRPSDRDCPESRANLAELLRLRDHRAPSGGHTLTLGAFLTGWLRDVKPILAPATWRRHESICRVHIGPALGDRRLSELSVADVRLLLSDGRLDPQTRRHHRATLRRALADALREGLVTRNVAALAEPPRMSKPERTYLNAEQVRTLIAGTKDDRLHALWTLAATTGMREAEMLALTWADIELGDESGQVVDDHLSRGARGARRHADSGAGPTWRENAGRGRDVAQASRGSAVPVGPSVTVRATLHRVEGKWVLRDPKTARSRRTIPLTPVAVNALREHRRRQFEEQARLGVMGREGLVFTTAKGQPLHGPNLSKLLYAALDQLGIARVTVHDLRHSCATVLFSMGIPVEVISRMLGHTNSRITSQIYMHHVPELQHEAAAAMERAVG
jgi:integrase